MPHEHAESVLHAPLSVLLPAMAGVCGWCGGRYKGDVVDPNPLTNHKSATLPCNKMVGKCDVCTCAFLKHASGRV